VKKLNIVFMGSPDFAVPSLNKLHESGHTIVAVVTGPDKKRGRGSALSPTPVKEAAQLHQIHVIESDSMHSPELQDSLKRLNPDLFVVVAFKLLPDSLLKIPNIGSVNLHASLLPKFRGAAPIHHAVMQGETKTGCTIFMLDSGMDTGGIIDQNTIDIGIDETTGSVYERLMHTGSDLLLSAVKNISEGTYTLNHQDESKATKAPKLFDHHCHVDFHKPAHEVHNQIRGLSPFPCAYAMLNGKKIKLLKSTIQVGSTISAKPGEMVVDGANAFVGCLDKPLCLLHIQPEGKRVMPASDFLRGQSGDVIFSNAD